MRWAVLGLALLLVACGAPAPGSTVLPPELVGDWQGSIRVPGAPVAVAVHVTGYGGTVDIPAQGIAALPLADVRVDGATVSFALPGLPGGATFTGSFDGRTISGEHTRAGRTDPFVLTRGELAPAARPQEPIPPLPYVREDVTYPSGDLMLAGTLTRPAGTGPFAAVLLISGSGAQDRDATVAGHRPFLVLADALTRAGYAVLRVDDRGVGRSGGDHAEATYDDLTADVLAGVAFLAARPTMDAARIGLLGHSEGGYLAPLAAQRASAQPPPTRRSGAGVAFMIMLAGPAVPGDQVLELQNRLIFEQAGASPDQVEAQASYVRELTRLLRARDYAGARTLARARITEQSAALPPAARPTPAQIEAQLPVSTSYREFVVHDPAPALAAVRVPVLAVFGDRDLQVPPAQSEPAMRTLLAGDPDTTIRTVAGVNHLMQPSATGAPTEYGSIETTMAPEVLHLVTDWLRERFPG